jgi:RNA polymerase sigma factor (sigma-70 family)
MMRVLPQLRRTQEPALTLEQLSECYITPVYRYLYRRLGPGEKADADDLTAQTFQAALRGQHRLKKDSDPYLWLLGIARRELINHARRQKYRKTEPLDTAPEPLATEHSPESVALGQERQRQLWRILDSLAADQREALLLQHLDGLSVAQIAQVLGKSHAATNSLLQRARQSALARGGAYFLDDETETMP